MNPITSTATGGVSALNLATMDLETALMTVQQQRTKLLDAQLQGQINEVTARNDSIAKMNDALTALTSYKGMYGGDAKGDTTMLKSMDKMSADDKAAFVGAQAAANKALEDAGFASGLPELGMDKDGKSTSKYGLNTQGDTKLAQVEAAITAIKGKIDGLSNTQQTDMLRLQSLSNKRNEAFDTMTNFIKKMQDSRSSIIGNMR